MGGIERNKNNNKDSLQVSLKRIEITRRNSGKRGVVTIVIVTHYYYYLLLIIVIIMLVIVEKERIIRKKIGFFCFFGDVGGGR